MAEESVKDIAAQPIDVVEQVGSLMDFEKSSQLMDSGIELLIIYGPKILAAIAIFIVGKMAIYSGLLNKIKPTDVKIFRKSLRCSDLGIQSRFN